MDCRLLVDKTTLKKSSAFLEQIHQQICKNQGDLNIELTHTLSENKLLCGMTIDGRNLDRGAIFQLQEKNGE